MKTSPSASISSAFTTVFETFVASKTRPGFPISSLLPAFRPASVVTSDFEKAEVTTDAGRKAGRREEMGKPGRVFDATKVSKTVVKALEQIGRASCRERG